MNHRIGKFTLPTDMVFGEQAQEIFKQLKFVPLRCESMYHNSYEYIGISPMFAEVEEGFLAPEYVITIVTIDHTKRDAIAVSVQPI